MRVDIIVPNFDEKADEVTLSAWYKKEGDRISKNEIIADAETNTIACGITSSYDCILAKILVKEGEVISQGTKIAVIETDLDADVQQASEKDAIKEESAFIDKSLALEEQKLENSNGYVLSVSEEEDKELERELEEEAMEMSTEVEEKVLESVGENRSAIDEEVIDEFADHTEKKFMNILKDAEVKAREEALKVRHEIIENAEKKAHAEGEDLKSKILRDYEEKATKDANEMHSKIMQGSLEEANATKTKIINEAKEAAQEEAKKIKESILEDAKIEAGFQAEERTKDIINQAQEQAKKEAAQKAKNIIESTISEAKQQAKEIKKDIIHSATKHAAKESREIVREAVKKAKRQSNLYTEELLNETTQRATKEAEALRNEILNKTHEEIKTAVKSTLKYVLNDVNKEVRAVAQQEKDKMVKEMKDEEKEKVSELLNIGDNGTPGMYADNWNKPQFFATAGDENEQIDLVRRKLAEKMKNTYDTSVISTVSTEVDMSAILSLEKIFGKAFEEKYNTRLGFTPFFIMACIDALKHYKIFNAHIHKDDIIYKNYYDISVITCGNDGVAAPVIRGADRLSIAEIEKTMIALSRRAVEGTLSVEEVSGGTFTVINAGIYGSLIGTDLLTPPQVATLSVHKMHNRPIATDNGVEIRPMLYISLSYDHVIADTKQASEFVACVKNYVENPGWKILGL